MPSETRQAPSLRDVQELLYDLMTAPSGVAPALAARGLGRAALDGLIAGDERLGAVARLDIYANMYFFRILDVLREEFPRVSAALGADAFHDLITDYLLAERPAHPSLREVGGRLPGFLRAPPPGQVRRGPPWLAELAALERTHRELFDARDAEPLALAALQGLTAEAFSTLPVRLIPAQRVLVHAFALSRVWQGGGEPEECPETLLVWRRGTTVHHRAVVNDAESAMLRRALEPATLADLCQVFGELFSEAPAAEAPPRDDGALAREAFQILARWVDDGLLAGA